MHRYSKLFLLHHTPLLGLAQFAATNAAEKLGTEMPLSPAFLGCALLLVGQKLIGYYLDARQQGELTRADHRANRSRGAWCWTV